MRPRKDAIPPRPVSNQEWHTPQTIGSIPPSADAGTAIPRLPYPRHSRRFGGEFGRMVRLVYLLGRGAVLCADLLPPRQRDRTASADGGRLRHRVFCASGRCLADGIL